MCVASRFVSILLISFCLICCQSGSEDRTKGDTTGIFMMPVGISLKDSLDNKKGIVHVKDMIYVPSGALTLIDESNNSKIRLFVHSFLLDSTEVTVKDFKSFIQRTHYKTDAEKYGNAGVFNMISRSWGLVDGASFLYPKGNQGKTNTIANDLDPATQISWYDANAYCKSLGKRLPNEIEWEHAARNGRDDRWMYSWGDDWSHSDTIYGNVWQGDFPYTFSNLDGYETIAPVGSFRSSPLGFKDLSGNVWEWCDNWRFEYGQLSSMHFNEATEKVIRGGSFLCAPNYCHGYRISARMFTTPETSLMHIGCRCAKDLR